MFNLFPDPSLTSFNEAASIMFRVDTPVTLSFAGYVTNVASAQSGNDVVSVSSPNKNYVITLQVSDVDMETGSDGLG